MSQQVEPLDCRFVLDGAAGAAFREALAADMSSAQLSRLFRMYYALRALLPLPLRQLLQRCRRVAAGPRWAYPDDFVRSLAGELQHSGEELTAVHPWPDGSTFAFVLTHDVETAEGMKRVLQIAEMEQELGFRSAWNFVPYKYAVDRGLLRELADRGFEIGVHGYNHDGKLFTSRAAFDRRVPAINDALRAWGAVGFRAPMVHRNLAWMQSLDIEYDASCFDADPYQAMPGGVGSVWPFIAGRFVELPYTTPQDHTLFIARHEHDGRIWNEKLSYLLRLNGMALFLTHPDYLDSPRRLDIYRQLLCRAHETTGMWHALPREIADWWRSRDQLRLEQKPTGGWEVLGPAADRGRLAAIRLHPALGQDPAEFAWIEQPARVLQDTTCPA